jgi:hypothetical protein
MIGRCTAYRTVLPGRPGETSLPYLYATQPNGDTIQRGLTRKILSLESDKTLCSSLLIPLKNGRAQRTQQPRSFGAALSIVIGGDASSRKGFL